MRLSDIELWALQSKCFFTNMSKTVKCRMWLGTFKIPTFGILGMLAQQISSKPHDTEVTGSTLPNYDKNERKVKQSLQRSITVYFVLRYSMYRDLTVFLKNVFNLWKLLLTPVTFASIVFNYISFLGANSSTPILLQKSKRYQLGSTFYSGQKKNWRERFSLQNQFAFLSGSCKP